jgi:putative MFS transporter
MDNKDDFREIEIEMKPMEKTHDKKYYLEFDNSPDMVKEIDQPDTIKQDITAHNNAEEHQETDIETSGEKGTGGDLIEELIEKCGITFNHIKMFSVIALFLLADGAEMIVISLLVSKLGTLWNLDVSQKGFMGSAVFVGFFFGAIVAGKLSDNKGRKPTYIVGSIIVCLFSSLSAFSPNYPVFLIFRALNGFGIGMTVPSASSLSAEITPTTYRGWVLNLVWVLFPVGEILAVVIARSELDSENGWRMLLGLAAIPCFLACCVSCFINESFRYYFSTKQFERGFDGLSRLIGRSLTDSEKDKIKSQLEKIPPIKSEFRSLFAKEYFWLTIKTGLIFYISSLVYYGVVYILPQTLEAVNILEDETDPKQMYIGIIISAFVEIPSTFLTGYLMNLKILGRVRSLMLGFLFTALASMFCSIFIYGASKWASVIKFGINIPFGVIYIYVAEAFPTNIRTIALGVTNSFTRLGGITTPLISQAAFSKGIVIPFIIYAIASVFGVWLSYSLPFETLGKKII